MPNSPRTRKLAQAVRAVDIAVYTVVLVCGLYVLFNPPDTVEDALGKSTGLIVLWAGLLAGGGLIGLIGRLTRRWLLEAPGPVAAFFGIAIYLVVIGNYLFVNSAATTAVTVSVVAMGFMFRRWLELQMFGSEPNMTMADKRKAAFARRTVDAVIPRT